MNKIRLKEGQRLYNKIQDYSKYKDKVSEVLIHPARYVHINSGETLYLEQKLV